MARLGDVCTIVNGKNQSKVENPNGRYPIYGSGGIMGYADDYICEAETVIIGRKGNINKPIFVSTPFWNVDTAFGLCADRSKLLPKYLFYFCEQFDFEKLNTTVTIPSLTKANLLEVDINVPPIEKQRSIILLLDKIASLISLRKQQLSKLDELVKARFVEMFGDPVRNSRDWKTKPFSECCNGIGDGLHGTPEYDDDGEYPFINGNNLIDGKISITGSTKKVGQSEFDRLYIEIEDNAILLSINGSLGKLALYNGEQIVLGKSACYCNVKESVNRLFVYGVMNSTAFQDFLEDSSTKSTIKNVGLKAIREFQMICPPDELQGQFSDFAKETDKSRLTIRRSLDKLEMLKKALMQKYFG